MQRIWAGQSQWKISIRGTTLSNSLFSVSSWGRVSFMGQCSRRTIITVLSGQKFSLAGNEENAIIILSNVLKEHQPQIVPNSALSASPCILYHLPVSCHSYWLLSRYNHDLDSAAMPQQVARILYLFEFEEDDLSLVKYAHVQLFVMGKFEFFSFFQLLLYKILWPTVYLQ
jgi:hypothetical protein